MNLRENIKNSITATELGDISKENAVDYILSLFRQAADEIIGEDDNVASITHRVENVRTGYNLAKQEARERLNKLTE